MSYDVLANALLSIPKNDKKLNGEWLGVVVGVVKVAPPEIEVEINNGLILKKNKLTVNYNLTDYYKRDYTLEGKIDKINLKTTTDNKPNKPDPTPHVHPHGDIAGDGDYKTTGNITKTDHLKVGDKILLIPELGNKIFHIIMKLEVFK
ncbi:MAG: DUF2577 family protein [Cetobacterium sp.]